MSRSGVEIRPAVLADIDLLVPNLRPADLDEIAAGSGVDPGAALTLGLTYSRECYTAFFDGEIAAIFGVMELSEGIGAPWLLGTTAIDRKPRAFIAHAGHYIQRMRAQFPTLVNVVHDKNAKAVRWLRRMGFEILPAMPYGHGMFHQFVMR